MTIARRNTIAPLWVFVLCWLAAFILYFPAATAGKAGDYYQEWLNILRTSKPGFFLLAPYLDSPYYFTQLVMFGLYKIFDSAAWPWHIVSVTMLAANATLVCTLCYGLLTNTLVQRPGFIANGCALLFCISPYNTEVVVHEPCFHFNMGLLMMLLILNWVQKFIQTGNKRYTLWAALLFLCSAFSIEVFYLTPFYVLTMAWFYQAEGRHGRSLTRIFRFFTLPQLGILVIYFIVVAHVEPHLIVHNVDRRVNTLHYDFLTTAPKYLFQILLFGRFFQAGIKNAVYQFFDSSPGMIAFSLIVVLCFALLFLMRKRLKSEGKLMLLLLTWVLLGLLLIAPLNFPTSPYITFDRYIFFIVPFAFLLLLVFIHRAGRFYVTVVFFTAYSIISVFLLAQMNSYWHRAQAITDNLVRTFPKNTGKTIVLLDMPESFNGALMIGARPLKYYDPASSFKLMYDLEHDQGLRDTVCDVAAYEMRSLDDGAHVKVLTDSTAIVTLNSSGKWYQYHHTAMGMDHRWLKVNMVDTNSWYRLTLTHPRSDYLLLYTVGDKWKEVDWNKKNIDQY